MAEGPGRAGDAALVARPARLLGQRRGQPLRLRRRHVRATSSRRWPRTSPARPSSPRRKTIPSPTMPRSSMRPSPPPRSSSPSPRRKAPACTPRPWPAPSTTSGCSIGWTRPWALTIDRGGRGGGRDQNVRHQPARGVARPGIVGLHVFNTLGRYRNRVGTTSPQRSLGTHCRDGDPATAIA